MSACLLFAAVPLPKLVAQTKPPAPAPEAEAPTFASNPHTKNLFNAAKLEAQRGDIGRAISSYKDFVKRYPSDGLAASAQFEIGLLLEKQNKYRHAFKAYQKLIEQYPRSSDFDRAIERQFKLATLYLEGERLRFLGLPVTPSLDQSATMFESVIKNAPFSRFAPISQFNIGLVREKQGKLEEAVEAYATVVDQYNSHDIADDAQYQIGYIYLNATRKGSKDSSAKLKAIEAFEDFVYQFPKSEKLPQAEENLRRLQARISQDSLQIAQFYDKQKNYKAAAFYYDQLVKQEGNTKAAQIAKERLAQLKSQFGEDIVKVAPSKVDSGAKAKKRNKLRAKVDTKNRSDYSGPPPPAPKKAAKPPVADLMPPSSLELEPIQDIAPPPLPAGEEVE